MRREIKFLALSSLIIFGSCKTQEEIQREQMVDNLSIQMVENQSLTADSKVRLQNIEERLGMLTGQVEETNHSTKEQLSKEVQTLREKVTFLEEKEKANQTTQDMNQKRLTEIEDQLVKQDAYLKKLLATLSGATAAKKSSKKLSDYDSAMLDYKKGHYSSARPKLEALESSSKIKGSKRTRVLHNLGMVSYIGKDDKAAVVYFSKLFTEFPKSNYNANGMLFLSKSLVRMKQNDQAKQTLEELIKRFPKSKKVKDAKAMLKKL
ncbi:tol-pal system YbgF family protein [Halobacteriovorax sp. HLS]|uniref:tetratricopeptide repeat protein n=1 Tax=Halobacteriovorax sp. HLS TaxID=2234000 RepID=UPI000FDA6657|nr:tetratricopeptide repeat protein [Halobacteriovorax sp. HLS]